MAISRNKVTVWSIVVVLLIAGGCAAYIWITLHWSFSSGERAGYLQKFSHKGWLCKTWEGELQMIPAPGSLPEKFTFSIRDDAVAKRVNASIGRKVVLHYDQHRGVPGTCFGETEYYVTDLRMLE